MNHLYYSGVYQYEAKKEISKNRQRFFGLEPNPPKN